MRFLDKLCSREPSKVNMPSLPAWIALAARSALPQRSRCLPPLTPRLTSAWSSPMSIVRLPCTICSGVMKLLTILLPPRASFSSMRTCSMLQLKSLPPEIVAMCVDSIGRMNMRCETGGFSPLRGAWPLQAAPVDKGTST